MADFGSGRTTQIPYLSITTMDDRLPDAPQFHIPTNATLNADGDVDVSSAATLSGRAAFTGQLDASASTFYSRSTSGSEASTTLQDGEFAIMSVSATSAVLVHRSGNTTYQWIADAGSVL